MGRFIKLIFLLLLLSSTPSAAQPQLEVRVGAVVDSPYVVSARQGLAINVWREAAHRAGIEYVLEEREDLEAAMKDLREERLHAVVGALAYEPKLARGGTLGPVYYVETLGLLSKDSVPRLSELAPFLLDKKVLFVLGVLSILIVVAGLLLWWAERSHEGEHFPEGPSGGLATGMWFALMTFTTVGYGDVTVKTRPGRWIAAALMISTLFLQALLTAALASNLTATMIDGNFTGNPEALRGQKVAVVGGSPADEAVSKYGAKTRPYPTLELALDALEANEVKFVAGGLLQVRLLNQLEGNDEMLVSDTHLPLRLLHFALDAPLREKLSVHLAAIYNEGLVEQGEEAFLGEARAQE